MDTSVAASAIRVIRAERESRISRLVARGPDSGYDEWLYTGEPFINELCLMLLVAVRHQVERELVQLAARTTSDGRELGPDEYRQRIEEERNQLKCGWDKLIARLNLKVLADWSLMETLRLLANSYKHNPQALPDDKLLNHLGLAPGVPYAPLAESQAIKGALSASLGLTDDANFCDIADKLLSHAGLFLADAARVQPRLSRVRRGAASLKPKDFAR